MVSKLSISNAPTSFRRGSLGHVLHGTLKTRSVTTSKPAASNQPFQRTASSTGVSHRSHATRRRSENSAKAPLGGRVLSSHWMAPTMDWNSTQPPGLRPLFPLSQKAKFRYLGDLLQMGG